MRTKQFLFVILYFFSVSITVQPQSSTTTTLTRDERFTKLEPIMIYPVIKGGKMTGAIPVENITNKPDAATKLNLIFDFTQETTNKAQGTHANEGLEEVGRIMNLHIAAGIKKENLKTTIIFHSGSIMSLLNDKYYLNKFGNENPNNDLFTQLIAAGTELIVCGQSLQLRDVDQKDLLPAIQIALSAKTTLSKYQQKGYIVFAITHIP